MNATLSFNLPEEADAHQAALDGPKWKSVAGHLDEVFRTFLKHGHPFVTAEEALQAARDTLNQKLCEEGLALYT